MSIAFDGNGDYNTTGDTTTFKWLHGALDTSAFKFSICFSVSLPDPNPGAGDTFVFVSTAAGSETGVGIDYFFYDGPPANARRINFRIYRGAGGTRVLDFVAVEAYPNDTNEHFIVFTYDQALANTNAKLYVDASSVATGDKTVSAPNAANSTKKFTMGMGGEGSWGGAASGSAVAGNMINLEVYDRVLSQAEIDTKDHAKGNDNITNNLKARWLMNELPSGSAVAGASSVIDISGNGHHASPAGDPAYLATPIQLTRPLILK